jgi:hypothetical protein
MKFYLDSFKGVFEGENHGFWNGWACPIFSKSEAIKIMDMFNSQKDSGVVMSYDDDKKAFLTIVEGADDEEFEETNDGRYAIGAWSWCWDIKEEENEKV